MQIRQSRSVGKRTGFTLIELLVVIAIIAILAAILFPVFARARENARRTSCQSNLKQIALGVFQYKQDYDEKLPVPAYSNGAGTSASPYGWADSLQPYLKSTQILVCPSNTTSTPIDMTGVPGYGPGSKRSYRMASYLMASSLSAVNAPALTVQLVDARNTGTTPATWYFGYEADATGQVNDGGSQNVRHLNTLNFLYADGHVKALVVPGQDPNQLRLNGHPNFSSSACAGTTYSGTCLKSAADLPTG